MITTDPRKYAVRYASTANSSSMDHVTMPNLSDVEELLDLLQSIDCPDFEMDASHTWLIVFVSK